MVVGLAAVALVAGASAVTALVARALAAGTLAVGPSEVAPLGIVEEQVEASSGHLLSFRVPAGTSVQADSLVGHIRKDVGSGSSRHS